MSEEKVEKIVCIGTHAGDDPERSAMPFVIANAALTLDINATIVLQGKGVHLAQKGYVDTMLPSGGFPHMKKLLSDFIELGGELLICSPCIRERKINEADLVKGAKISGAASVVTAGIEADALFTY